MNWGLCSIGGLVLVLATGLGSCGFAADKSDAEETVREHFAALDREDYETAIQLYHPRLVANASPGQLRSDLQAMRVKLGPREASKLVAWEVQKGTQSWVELVYESQYEAAPAIETFRLRRVDGEFRIEAHSIESRALLR